MNERYELDPESIIMNTTASSIILTLERLLRSHTLCMFVTLSSGNSPAASLYVSESKYLRKLTWPEGDILNCCLAAYGSSR